MDKSRFLRIWEISALVSLCVCLCAAVWAQGRSSAISADLVRLHVLAVSDDAYEQALKLRVRDAVLEYITPRLDGSESPADARAVLSRELDGIGRAAASAAEGRQVTVSLGTELYPSREYEGFTLPAGRYESLRVVLGEGEGHNWWCIVFPPVCLSAVQSEQVEEAMSVEDYALITRQDGYELRFRTVELWGELLEKLEEHGWIAAGAQPRRGGSPQNRMALLFCDFPGISPAGALGFARPALTRFQTSSKPWSSEEKLLSIISSPYIFLRPIICLLLQSCPNYAIITAKRTLHINS